MSEAELSELRARFRLRRLARADDDGDGDEEDKGGLDEAFNEVAGVRIPDIRSVLAFLQPVSKALAIQFAVSWKQWSEAKQ